MSQHTMPPIASALLLYEQTPQTRVTVAAPVGTKAGQFVDYPAREGKKLVALSDERGGKVIVQPFNCVINAALLNLDEARAAASTEGTFEGLQKDGDPHGIMYANAPNDAPRSPPASDRPMMEFDPPPAGHHEGHSDDPHEDEVSMDR